MSSQDSEDIAQSLASGEWDFNNWEAVVGFSSLDDMMGPL